MVVSLLAALTLYAASAMAVFKVIIDAVRADLWEPAIAKRTAVSFLKVIDLLLIAAGLQIIAVGMYRLFINENLSVPAPMEVRDFGELKKSIIKVAAIVLVIVFLEHAVNFGPGEHILEFGVAIAAVIASAAWASSLEDKGKH